jgi:XRE family aerobic/anaerobic benzoate catabolism transcriptional regulator
MLHHPWPIAHFAGDGEMLLDPVTESENSKQSTRRRQDSAFLERLGDRVRTARGQRAFSRKLLAEYAGVSVRYLAQLEAGKGNISIILLRNIAAALDLALEELVCEDQAVNSEIGIILQMLRRATPEERRSAKDVLTRMHRQSNGSARAQRIALIGLRGAGKSTLGRLAAGDLGAPFIELNDEIAKMSGLSVPEIFNLYGPEGFRRLERRCLQQVIDTNDSVVLATGGGIVADPTTYDTLLSAFFAVWLRTAPEEHMERVRAQGDMRPMAGNVEAMDDLKLILSSRETLYGRADRELDTSNRSVEECRSALAELLKREGFFSAPSLLQKHTVQ